MMITCYWCGQVWHNSVGHACPEQATANAVLGHRELDDLRAYRDRTEAALRKLALMPGKRRWVEESMKALGLWRESKETKETNNG